MSKISHAHKLVARTARESAAELYEIVMSANDVRAEWKRQNPGASERVLLSRFVEKNWVKCIPLARTALGLLLRQDSISEGQKEEIVEALALDTTLQRGRVEPATVLGRLN